MSEAKSDLIPSKFYKELEELINRHSVENHSNTPDYLLAKYVMKCLVNYAETVKQRDQWFGFEPFKNMIRWRVCEFCGCNTNAKCRRCCEEGYLADIAT